MPVNRLITKCICLRQQLQYQNKICPDFEQGVIGECDRGINQGNSCKHFYFGHCTHPAPTELFGYNVDVKDILDVKADRIAQADKERYTHIKQLVKGKLSAIKTSTRHHSMAKRKRRNNP